MQQFLASGEDGAAAASFDRIPSLLPFASFLSASSSTLPSSPPLEGLSNSNTYSVCLPPCARRPYGPSSSVLRPLVLLCSCVISEPLSASYPGILAQPHELIHSSFRVCAQDEAMTILPSALFRCLFSATINRHPPTPHLSSLLLLGGSTLCGDGPTFKGWYVG
jgi:hypothetical protein